jgi:hypothetical protein
MNLRNMTITALLAALIAISGSFKIPGFIPGTEFQLSAPLAVAICAVYGFQRYFIAGVIASILVLMLGTQTVLNVAIALLFRVVIGILFYFGGTSLWMIVIVGPIASFIARLFFIGIIGQAGWVIIFAAIPGMIYTALAACPFTVMLRRVRQTAERMLMNVV